ncbi:MAG: carboxypeptidase-like regulatory domain-containing protein [Candidatus Bathyarchaeota archaeon]|nr:carboxypeptidase-like regulatory domain-containing protein [Candidatus Bathyarchaeota archaeon]
MERRRHATAGSQRVGDPELTGTISYDAASNVLSAVGGTAEAPVGFADLWNADKAGTLMLLASKEYASNRVLGKNTDGANTNWSPPSWKWGSKVTLSESAVVKSITYKAKNTTVGQISKVKFAVYSDSGGVPNTLLGVTAEGALADSAEWLTLNLTAPLSLSAGVYWLVVLAGDYANSYDYSAGSTNQFGYNANAYASGFSNPFGSASYLNWALAIYATYDTFPAALSLTRQTRPADALAVKLNIVVAAGGGAGYSVTLTGTDKDGNAQTETVTLTGTGTFTTTKWFKTVNAGGVSVTVPSGGSVTFSITQSQWGVASKQGDTNYSFDCNLQVGDGATATYFADLEKHVVVTGNCQIRVKAGANFRLGKVASVSDKIGVRGCSLHFSVAASYLTLVLGEDGSLVEFYDSKAFMTVPYTGYIWHYGTSGTQLVFWQFETNIDLLATAGPVTDAFQVTSTGNNGISYRCRGSADQIRLLGNTYIYGAIGCDYNCGSVFKNIYARSNPNLFRTFALSADVYAVNVDSDIWSIRWEMTNTARIFRQYEFDLAVTDKNGAPVENATVTLTDKDGTQVFSVTTDGNGAIETQTVTRGFYQQTTEDTLQDYSPHTLTATKSGYQTYTKKFTLTQKTKWEIKLSKTQPILLDCGKPTINLNAADPENRLFFTLSP